MKFASTALVVIATLTSGWFGTLGQVAAHAGNSGAATAVSAAVSHGTTEWGVVKPTA
ncbi:hypothetical protein [Streptomyces sp. NPDC007205]|uniref:hypothetical protein n=1 Tax=Streptomyces sp. NPDC007205 TaxID=3154316 RepID=UPI0034097047